MASTTYTFDPEDFVTNLVPSTYDNGEIDAGATSVTFTVQQLWLNDNYYVAVQDIDFTFRVLGTVSAATITAYDENDVALGSVAWAGETSISLNGLTHDRFSQLKYITITGAPIVSGGQAHLDNIAFTTVGTYKVGGGFWSDISGHGTVVESWGFAPNVVEPPAGPGIDTPLPTTLARQDFPQEYMFCSAHNTIIITGSGTAKICGNNNYGHINNDPGNPATSNFTDLPIPVDVVPAQFAWCSGCLLMLTTSGNLWAYGRDAYLGNVIADWTMIDFGVLQLVGPGNGPHYQVSDYGARDGFDYPVVVYRKAEGWYGTGKNVYGELGLNHTNPVTTWELLTWDASSTRVQLNENNLAMVNANDELYMAGFNFQGNMGLGDFADRTVPTQCLTGVAGIRLGDAETGMMMNDGTIRLCGDGRDHVFGLGHELDQPNWINPGFSNVEQLIMGGIRTIVRYANLTRTGSGWLTWSAAQNPSLNEVTTWTSMTDYPGPAANILQEDYYQDIQLRLMTNGDLYAAGSHFIESWSPWTLVDTDVRMIQCAFQRFMWVKSNGSVWALGQNGSDQRLGAGSNGSNHPETPLEVLPAGTVNFTLDPLDP